MTIKAHQIGSFGTDTAADIICLSGAVTTATHYSPLQNHGVDYVVPPGKTLILCYCNCISLNANGFMLLASDTAVIAPDAAALTAGVILCQSLGTPAAYTSYVYNIHMTIAAGLYAAFYSQVALGRITVWGYLV